LGAISINQYNHPLFLTVTMHQSYNNMVITLD
jgi:hypothetical protein